MLLGYFVSHFEKEVYTCLHCMLNRLRFFNSGMVSTPISDFALIRGLSFYPADQALDAFFLPPPHNYVGQCFFYVESFGFFRGGGPCLLFVRSLLLLLEPPAPFLLFHTMVFHLVGVPFLALMLVLRQNEIII